MRGILYLICSPWPEHLERPTVHHCRSINLQSVQTSTRTEHNQVHAGGAESEFDRSTDSQRADFQGSFLPSAEQMHVSWLKWVHFYTGSLSRFTFRFSLPFTLPLFHCSFTVLSLLPPETKEQPQNRAAPLTEQTLVNEKNEWQCNPPVFLNIHWPCFILINEKLVSIIHTSLVTINLWCIYSCICTRGTCV